MNNLGSDKTNRTRTRRLVAAGLAAAVVVTTLAGSASAAPRVIEPENLKRGVDAKLAYSDGSTLHTRSGDLVPLPETPDLGVNDVRLLGRTSSGWVVWERDYDADGYRNTLHTVAADGRSTVLHEHTTPDVEFNDFDFWYGLSESGNRYVEWLADEGVGGLTVRNLAGEVVGTAPFATEVLDFSGPRLAYLMDTRPFVWKPGSKPHQVMHRVANFAELRHDVLFVRTLDGRFGPTRLSHPGKVRWKAHFQAIRLSPDGRRVLGMKTPSGSRHTPVFQFRRMRDGALMSSFKYLNPRGDIAWETNGAVLFKVTRSSDFKDAVARCKVSGKCTRASAWQDMEEPLSFAHTPQY